nr:hypothetical protein [Tanacetum cinerariifolium]
MGTSSGLNTWCLADVESRTVRRDDDKLYKFKEGNFKRLRIQDIEDMLLLLVQGKLTNLTVKERFAFNVSLRMFTRSIIIQQCVEDLQLGVKSYQKKLNLTKPDTYRSDRSARKLTQLTLIQEDSSIKIKTSRTERFDTSAGNHVKEILLKLNLLDHRILKDEGEGT